MWVILGLKALTPIISSNLHESHKVKSLSCVRLFAIPWTVVYQASLSMGFSSPGDLPDSGIELRFPALQADALPSELPGKPG